ncbi:uncharacterized protein LOC120154409 [Hibiscus syriacus]|uniref:uncharacterized protein LOC120154409 n=1 Tax=Hibiscus syriacus TaxID=106335 RepID=UPI0019233BB7|nr:uncharacterized protein LOC120154409 [Hibiscus syriacus]
MCIDYRVLNKFTVKNKYTIPLIADLFGQLGGARWFTKLDLWLRYYQVKIAKGDELKITCVTCYGSCEFLVMLFGITNAPTTFCTLMNKLNGTKRRYSVHEKEITVAYCKVFLAKFEFLMEDKLEKVNCVTNGLSHRYVIKFLKGSLFKMIKEGLPHKSMPKTLIDDTKEGRTIKFWIEGELLYTQGDHLYVLQYGKLRKELMKECHDFIWWTSGS